MTFRSDDMGLATITSVDQLQAEKVCGSYLVPLSLVPKGQLKQMRERGIVNGENEVSQAPPRPPP
jgi:hypothetical protein